MEEYKAQQDNRFLQGRQCAYMIYDYFKTRGTGEPLVDIWSLESTVEE